MAMGHDGDPGPRLTPAPHAAPADASAPATGPADVLVVEDSPEDFVAIKRTLRKLGLQGDINQFEEGESFVDHLRDRLERRQTLPNLVLLDLNMPGADGREVLVEIEAEPALAGRFPIVVLTTSKSADDAEFCAAHGATSYMTKPVGLKSLEGCLRHVLDYLKEGSPIPPRCS